MIVGIGTDIELVKRFKNKCLNNRFFTLVFTKAEREYCESKKEPYRNYAGKFCAKESVIKAIGEKIHPREIEVINDKKGKPEIWIRGKLDERIKCSISHCRNYAVAFVIINKNEK